MTWDLLNLIHTFDYYKSGDCGKEKYLNEKKAFKNKWFSNRGVRIRNVIDSAIDDLKEELYETYGIVKENRSWNLKNFLKSIIGCVRLIIIA